MSRLKERLRGTSSRQATVFMTVCGLAWLALFLAGFSYRGFWAVCAVFGVAVVALINWADF